MQVFGCCASAGIRIAMYTQHIACDDDMFTKIPKMTVKFVIPVGTDRVMS
jgi:hypothetical protein